VARPLEGRERVLASCEFRVLSEEAFQRSLYLVDTRCVYRDEDGAYVLSHHLPAAGGVEDLSLCFVVASREPGVAALCNLEIRGQYDGVVRPLSPREEQVLITDGPSLFLPAATALEDFQRATAFELFSAGHRLGSHSLRLPAPATFTSEGGFKSTEDYLWTTFTEDELNCRLNRLMEARYEEVGSSSSS